MNIEAGATEFRTEARQAGLVIDPEAIAMELGIMVRASWELLPRVRGLLIIGPLQDKILYHGRLSLAQRRATIAHELGHWWQHGEKRLGAFACTGLQSTDENLVDSFADALLIDRDLLASLAARIPNVPALAARFLVPESSIERRLVATGLSIPT